MASDPYERSTLMLTLLQLYPPSICESLISDAAFRKGYGLRAEAQVSLGDSEVAFQRSRLFNGVREVLSGGNARTMLKDMTGGEWCLEIDEENNKRRIALLQGDRRFLFPYLYSLSSILEERLCGFERDADEANLKEPSLAEWREKLASGPLEDEEVDSLQKDLNDTPIRVTDIIISQIEEGESTLSLLVPTSARYFYRLIGELQDSTNVSHYSQQGANEHIQQLLAWRPYEGFLFSLLLASHPLFPSRVQIDHLKEDDLLRAYEWLAKSGDRISQIGAAEIWLSNPRTLPKAEIFVRDIIHQLQNDNEEIGGRLSLLSALIVLVEGELARTKILADKPPFYRRLASIAQASLIERCIVASKIDTSDFSKWAMHAKGLLFYLQSMADIRQEPRWDPEYISPHQLKLELIGRIFNATQNSNLATKESFLRDLLADKDAEDVSTLRPPLFAFLPGPLEGGVESQNVPPPEVLRMIEEQLRSEVLEPTSFAALVNSALFFRLDSYQAQLAARALRSVKHQIKRGDNKELIFPVLRGLATVAAVTRSVELAEELRILTRRCRHESGRSLSAEEAMWIGIIAAAAYSDLTRWCEFLGEWMTELAFQLLERGDMRKLHSHVKQLLHLVPELWLTLGRAEAALSVAVDI